MIKSNKLKKNNKGAEQQGNSVHKSFKLFFKNKNKTINSCIENMTTENKIDRELF